MIILTICATTLWIVVVINDFCFGFSMTYRYLLVKQSFVIILQQHSPSVGIEPATEW